MTSESAGETLRATAVAADGDLFNQVIALASGGKDTLGFLTDSGFRDRARKATLVAACRGATAVGYVMYDLRARDAKIVQLCVDPAARGCGVARFLIDAVMQRHPDHRRLTLRCRADYAVASRVWESLDFRPVYTLPGRRLSGSELTVWLHDDGDDDLFQSLATDRKQAALDHNVFIDLHTTAAERPQGDVSRVLQSDWIGEFVELVVTDEVSHEIQRLTDVALKKSQFEQIGSYRRIKGGPWRDLGRLAAQIAPKADPSDHRHVARAAAAGATFLLSRDDELLKKADALEKAVGVRVLDPASLIVHLDRLQADGPYRPRDLEGTELQTASPTEDLHQDFLRALHNNGSGARLGAFRQRVAPMLADTRSHETEAVRTADGSIVAGFIRTSRAPDLDVPLLRVAPGAQAASVLARQLVYAQRAEAARRGAKSVVVSDPAPSRDVLDALRTEGFTTRDCRWSCEVSPGLHRASDLSAVADAAEGARFERTNWPGRVLDAGIVTYLVPINVSFAADLVDPGLAEGAMFKRDAFLGLAREHVYYRSIRNHRGIHPGARILWYVTGVNQVHRRSSIRAVSQVAEVRCGDPAHLFSRFERFGVYSKAQVIATAGTAGKVMAIRFVDTETFETPLNLDELRAIAGLSGEAFVPSPGPSILSEHMFASIYSRSSRYASR